MTECNFAIIAVIYLVRENKFTQMKESMEAFQKLSDEWEVIVGWGRVQVDDKKQIRVGEW
jgi:aspartate ammonia-lyase